MKTKIITIFFSALLAGSFLFMGFNRFITPEFILKIDDDKVTIAEFNELFSEHKNNLKLKQLSPQEEIVAKINYLGQLVNEISLKKYLKEKIKLNENSILTVLKKTLGDNKDISQFSTSQFENIVNNLGDEINKEIFLNSLESELFKGIEIDEKLLKEKIVKIYEIKNKNLSTDSISVAKYENEVNTYEIKLEIVDLTRYIKETIINESIIDSYYNENLNIFTKPKTFSYDQIIIKQNSLSSNNFEDYKNDENSINSFKDIQKQNIIPQIYNVINELNENEVSKVFKVGNLNYIVKLNKINNEIIYPKNEVKEEIINKITDNELKNLNQLELNKINNKFIEKEILYSDNFLFEENLNKNNYKIYEDQKEGTFKNKDKYYEYKITKISINKIPLIEKNNFINKYINFINQRDQEINSYNTNDLTEIDVKNINYFLRSLEIKNEKLSEDQLNNVILIKKDKPIKVKLTNKVYILKYIDENSLNSELIQNKIINIFYNELLNAIKSLYKIEINNEKLLQ